VWRGGVKGLDRRAASGTTLTLLLVGLLAVTINVSVVEAGGTVYIRADGSVDPLDSILPVHNVAAVNVTTILPYGASAAYPRWMVNVNITVENRGDFTENFTVTAYYNYTNFIAAQNVTDLLPGNTTALTIPWNTWNIAPNEYNYTSGQYTPYTITVNISSPTLGETTWYDGTVTVRRFGDANGDGHCDGFDYTYINVHWLTVYPDIMYDPNPDFKGDGAIDGFDWTYISIYWCTF